MASLRYAVGLRPTSFLLACPGSTANSKKTLQRSAKGNADAKSSDRSNTGVNSERSDGKPTATTTAKPLSILTHDLDPTGRDQPMTK